MGNINLSVEEWQELLSVEYVLSQGYYGIHYTEYLNRLNELREKNEKKNMTDILYLEKDFLSL